MAELEVASLHRYPIKSCGVEDVEVMRFGEFGPEYDREWMLVNDRGRFLTQRTLPKMAQIRPIVTEDGTLQVAAPRMEPLRVYPDQPGQIQHVEFWKKAGKGITQGEQADEWFSRFLGRPAQLLRVFDARPVKPECRVDGAIDKVGFADGFPVLITSEVSLAALNQHVDEPIPMNRFRPNIVVKDPSGELDAYDEDYWRELRAGALTMYVVRACDRCPIPETDQETGEREHAKGPVTAALTKTRHGIDPVNEAEGNFFGSNAVYEYNPDIVVRNGDAVEIAERSVARNIIFW